MKKTGGIWFWKMGRFGGSFYISKPKPRKHIAPVTDLMLAAVIGFPAGMLIASIFF